MVRVHPDQPVLRLLGRHGVTGEKILICVLGLTDVEERVFEGLHIRSGIIERWEYDDGEVYRGRVNVNGFHLDGVNALKNEAARVVIHDGPYRGTRR